jgi:hypothetical protein
MLACYIKNIPNGVCVEDGELHIWMGKCKFLRVYLCRTQEKLERVLEAKKGLKVSNTDCWRKTTYKGVNVNRKTTWSAESKTGIGWRNASGSRTKCSERRALTGCNNYGQNTAGRATDIPKCMLLAVTARMAVDTPKCILLAVPARRATDIRKYMLAMQESSV